MDLHVDPDSDDIGFPSPVGSTASTVMDYESDHYLRSEDFEDSFAEEDLAPSVDQSPSTSIIWSQLAESFSKKSQCDSVPSTSTESFASLDSSISTGHVIDPKWDGWADYDHEYLGWLLKAETRLNVFDIDAPFVGLRRLIIGWLNDSCASMNIPVTTARAALALLDYVLTVRPEVASCHWDLVGLGCIVLACKYAEIDTATPLLNEVAVCGQHRYSLAEIRESELFVLRVTNWRIDTITPSHFITHHQQRFPEEYTDPNYVDLIESLLDCALQDYGCRNCRPSLIAEGVISAARQTLSMPTIPYLICTYPSQHISQVADLIIGLAEDFQQELVNNQVLC